MILRSLPRWLSAAAMLLLVACGSFPENPQLERFDPDEGYRLAQLDADDGNTDSLFVVVAMSGGGTRAAALSYGVLEALRDTTITWEGTEKSLLEEVDLISSVSGGSFTGAYYALHHKGIFDGRFESDFLKHDVEGDLIRELFIPSNWFKLAGRSYGRSDLAADYYHEHLFGSATYQALINSRRKPFLIVNATDMSLGAQFPFIQDQFDLICSDLGGLPLARSVASSSAFPGALTPLTYRNHAGQCGFQDYPWVSLAQEDRRENAERAIRADQRKSYYEVPPPAPGARDFVHLIDGGVSDNIGLRGPTYAISSTDPTYSIQAMMNRREIDKLVVIVVNAATSPDTTMDSRAAVPGLVDVVTAAATVPMDNYSVDTVSLLRAKTEEYNSGYHMMEACDAELRAQCPNGGLDLGALHPVDLYLVEVAFEFIHDPAKREWFKNIGTNFHLPSPTVEDLQNIGCTLYRQDPELKKLLAGDGRSREAVRGSLPEC